MQYRYTQFIVGCAFTAVFLALTFVFALVLRWPGNVHFCVAIDHCYCEAIRWDAPFRQPVNTWTNMLAVAFGLGMLWYNARCPVDPARAVNPMQREGFYPVLYAYCVIMVGLGSVWFHGGMVDHGGALDNVSMSMMVTFMICYTLVRLGLLDRRGFTVLMIVVNAAVYVLSFLPVVGRNIFTVLVVVAIPFEAIVLVRQHMRPVRAPFRRNGRWFLAALVAFGVATLAWELSKTGAVFCDPGSFWQGHALWHYLVAVAVLFVFLYYRSERPVAFHKDQSTGSMPFDDKNALARENGLDPKNPR